MTGEVHGDNARLWSPHSACTTAAIKRLLSVVSARLDATNSSMHRYLKNFSLTAASIQEIG